MSAEDELATPEVPEAKPGDTEDVSWALSTAEAMWARGDHLEGLKWVRKAAEAAGDDEDDERALELAKAASELATLIARRSRASLGEGPGYAGGAPPETPQAPPQRAVSTQPAAPSAPPLPPKSAPPVARSVPPSPIPLPSRASSAPKPPQAPPTPRAAPRPLATSDARQGPQAGRGILSNRNAPDRSPPESSSKTLRGRRRSRENLDAEAKQATGAPDTTPHGALDSANADHALRGNIGEVTLAGGSAPTVEIAAATTRAKRRSRPEPDPTVIGRIDDLVQAEREQRTQRHKSAAEWDASPTLNLTGDEMEPNVDAGDRATTAFGMPGALPASPSVPPPAPRAPTGGLHDPAIQTSQAVRVVVWRDATGVHIAPAGTVVSAITIDAVLVALEPSADLTAWLSQRER